MKKIGFIDNREIYYINVKDDVTWNAKLPFDNWCAFTVVNADGRELIDEIVSRCLITMSALPVVRESLQKKPS